MELQNEIKILASSIEELERNQRLAKAIDDCNYKESTKCGGWNQWSGTHRIIGCEIIENKITFCIEAGKDDGGAEVDVYIPKNMLLSASISSDSLRIDLEFEEEFYYATFKDMITCCFVESENEPAAAPEEAKEEEKDEHKGDCKNCINKNWFCKYNEKGECNFEKIPF